MFDCIPLLNLVSSPILFVILAHILLYKLFLSTLYLMFHCLFHNCSVFSSFRGVFLNSLVLLKFFNPCLVVCASHRPLCSYFSIAALFSLHLALSSPSLSLFILLYPLHPSLSSFCFILSIPLSLHLALSSPSLSLFILLYPLHPSLSSSCFILSIPLSLHLALSSPSLSLFILLYPLPPLPPPPSLSLFILLSRLSISLFLIISFSHSKHTAKGWIETK